MRHAFAFMLVLAAGGAALAADPPKPDPKADKLPVALVNMQKLMFESAPGKAVIKDLEDYVAKQQEDITKKQDEAAKIRTELKEKDKDLKPEQKTELEKKAVALETEASKIRTEAGRHLQRVQRNAISQLQAEADRVVKEFAKEKGIQLLIDTSREDGPKIIVINEAADITDEALKRIEKFKIKPLAEEKPDPKDDPKPQVVLETSAGEIVLELDREKAPKTVANFLRYVEAKHYDGTVFHRVIKEFMIQGGGMNENLEEKPTKDPIVNEATNGLKNVRGSIAMARTSDPDSATSQFFINVVDNAKLDHMGEARFGYAVFGKVVKGMDVVDKIRAVKTGSKKGNDDVPVEAIFIKAAKRVAKEAAGTKPEPKPEVKPEEECGADEEKDAKIETLMKDTIKLMEEMAGVLETIKDAATAKAADKKLDDLADKFVKIIQEGKKLGEPSPELIKKYEKQLQTATTRFSAALVKVASVPEAKEVLEKFSKKLAKIG